MDQATATIIAAAIKGIVALMVALINKSKTEKPPSALEEEPAGASEKNTTPKKVPLFIPSVVGRCYACSRTRCSQRFYRRNPCLRHNNVGDAGTLALSLSLQTLLRVGPREIARLRRARPLPIVLVVRIAVVGEFDEFF
jgi:hypothetical protein